MAHGESDTTAVGNKAGEAGRDSVLANLDVPSQPLSRGRSRAAARAAARKQALDLNEVERLASFGLNLEEILAELGYEDELPSLLKMSVEAAIKKGRTRGSAALKQAQYNAALDGKVTAQSQMLALLGSEDSSAEEEVVYTTERVIIGGDAEED